MRLKKMITKALLIGALSAFSTSAALAHSFNVTLFIPLSGPDEQQGKQFLDGFMLATRERDGHPNEESDGHLGGLDVYVTTLDSQGNVEEQIATINSQDQADIVTYFASQNTSSIIESNLDQSIIAILVPGEISDENGELLGNNTFFTTFNEDYNADPSTAAIRGYNAARRIDQTVRAQGGASSQNDLQEDFSQSATNFIW